MLRARLCKDFGFKSLAHIMPDLPGSQHILTPTPTLTLTLTLTLILILTLIPTLTLTLSLHPPSRILRPNPILKPVDADIKGTYELGHGPFDSQ